MVLLGNACIKIIEGWLCKSLSPIFPFRFKSTLNSMNRHMNEQMDILVSRWVEGPQGFSLKRLIWGNVTNYSLSESYSLSYTKADTVLGSSTINYKRFLYKDPWSMLVFNSTITLHRSLEKFSISLSIYIYRQIDQQDRY